MDLWLSPVTGPDDLTEITTEELVRLARSTTTARERHETAAKVARERQAQLIAELSRRPGWTFVRIGELLDMDDATAHRWAKPYL